MTIVDRGSLAVLAVTCFAVAGCGAGSARNVGDRSFALSPPERAVADTWDAEAPTAGSTPSRCGYWEERAREVLGGDERGAPADRREAGLAGYAQAQADVACGRVAAHAERSDRHEGIERSRHR